MGEFAIEEGEREEGAAKKVGEFATVGVLPERIAANPMGEVARRERIIIGSLLDKVL
jgi:hypothetical protein